jgi:hypothetical protein
MTDPLPDWHTSWWLDGIIGGLVRPVLMGMVAMVLFPLFGIGSFWQPLNLIAALFNQGRGTNPFFGGSSILGLALHMMVAAILGLIFAWSSRTRAAGGMLVGWAIVWGLVVWVVAQFFGVPLLDPVIARTFPAWLFAVGHVMYGVGLGGYLAWRWSRAPSERGHASPSRA